MILGTGPLRDDLWTCAKVLLNAPPGTIIRNGCFLEDPPKSGVYLKKIRSARGEDPPFEAAVSAESWARRDAWDPYGCEWVVCGPDGEGQWAAPDVPFQSVDVFLPVQVIEP